MLGVCPHYQQGRGRCAGAEIRGRAEWDGQHWGHSSSRSSSAAASAPGTSEELSQERTPRALLSLYLEAKRPVHEVEIQVIQFQVRKSLLAGSLHQRLLMKSGPQLEKKTRHIVTSWVKALS